MSPTSSPPLNPSVRSRGPQSDARSKARSKAKRSAAKDAGQPSSKKRAKARSEGDSEEVGGSRADESTAGGRATSDSSVQGPAEPPADVEEASHRRSRKNTVGAHAHETPRTGYGDLGQDDSADKGGPATAGVTSTDSTDRAGSPAEKAARGRGMSRSGGRARPSGKNPAAANSIGSSENSAGASKSKCRKSKKPAEPHRLAVAHEGGGEGPVVVECTSSGRPVSNNETASALRYATNDTTTEGPGDAAVASERDGDAISPTSITSIMATFWNQGYSTIVGILSDDEVDIVLRAINATHPREWLRQLGDQNRRQMDVDMRTDAASAHPAFRLVLERFIAFASQLHPSWSVCERLSVLESQPGAEAERLHRDFSASETAEAINAREWVQASFLLVLEPETVLTVVPGAFAGNVLRENWMVLDDMKPGDMLVYRGDLPHAEVASSKRNLRIQGCVNIDGIDHNAGVVERVAWAFYRCVHCFKRCDGKRALSNHVRYCNDNPDKEKIATKRKQNNDKGAYCKVCKHHFGKKNTYDAHNCHGADGSEGSGDNADGSTEK